jgi:protein-S-isoprenylcysteine O-methyltransferase Ste14
VKKADFIDRLFASNPMHRGMVEYLLLFGTGILGLIFSWSKIPFFPASNIVGGVLIAAGLLFHLYAEKKHRQAHEKSADIERIVQEGMFARIRHPLYLGIIVMNVGIALAFGVVITLIIALLSVFHWIVSALKEEEFLLQKFGNEYKRYMNNVKWRFIPFIF